MAKHSYRDAVLDAGLAAIYTKGYAATGVQEIVTVAGVPKGSFYNHFPSKEALAIAALEQHWDGAAEILAILRDESLPVPKRIDRHLAALGCPSNGCLIGNLTAELAGEETFRKPLSKIWNQWMEFFAECLAEGQADGSVQKKFSSQDLAFFVLSLWEGAVLNFKLERSPAVLRKARRLVQDFIRQ